MEEKLVEVTEDVLFKHWTALFPEAGDTSLMHAEHIYIENVKSFLIESDTISPLYFKPKAWKLDISRVLLNNALNASLLGAIINYTDHRQLPMAIIFAILNNLIQIDRVKISKEDEKIYLSMPVKKKYKTPEEWYNSLPEKVKRNTNELGFQDFLEKLVLAGLAKKDKKDEDKYLVLKKGNHIFKFHIT